MRAPGGGLRGETPPSPSEPPFEAPEGRHGEEEAPRALPPRLGERGGEANPAGSEGDTTLE
eukprot:873076-Alexandrium_andersonii.AAC.1